MGNVKKLLEALHEDIDEDNKLRRKRCDEVVKKFAENGITIKVDGWSKSNTGKEIITSIYIGSEHYDDAQIFISSLDARIYVDFHSHPYNGLQSSSAFVDNGTINSNPYEVDTNTGTFALTCRYPKLYYELGESGPLDRKNLENYILLLSKWGVSVKHFIVKHGKRVFESDSLSDLCDQLEAFAKKEREEEESKSKNKEKGIDSVIYNYEVGDKNFLQSVISKIQNTFDFTACSETGDCTGGDLELDTEKNAYIVRVSVDFPEEYDMSYGDAENEMMDTQDNAMYKIIDILKERGVEVEEDETMTNAFDSDAIVLKYRVK